LNKRSLTYIFYPILLSVWLFLGCTNKKNTAVTRTYHNITAKFNTLFNGTESYKKGVKKLEAGVKDDYSELLPVFPIAGEAVSASSEMDKAIKKSTKVIAFHSITAKPELKRGVIKEKDKEFYNKKEFNKWIDDCYLLIGKCHYQKKDYDLAIQTFRYILSNYPKEDVIPETRMWLVRSLTITDEIKEAAEIMSSIQTDKLSRRLRAYCYAVNADLLIHQKQFDDAIPKLELAVKETRTKSLRIRYTFILAQLYQKVGKFNTSFDKYGKVLDMNPPYEITFNAMINRASVFESGDQNEQDIVGQLKKMLTDKRNKEYLDQLYFALGGIYLKQDNKQEALADYLKSAHCSVSNTKQKAKSYITLADIYYNDRNYIPAASFYDTAFVLIDKTYPGYATISMKAKSLGKLVKCMNTVSFEDSVQRLAKLSAAERLTIIDGIIDKLKKDEEEKKQQDQERMLELQNSATSGTTSGTDAGGKWYFYNPASKGSGQPDFTLKWGNRPLEDNWRRSNKNISDVSDVDTESSDDSDEPDGSTNPKNPKAPKKKADNKTRAFYLKNIPLTDSALAVSNKRIRQSLYTAGNIYKNNLQEYNLAVSLFEDIIRRYPDDPMSIQMYYELYKLYDLLNNKEMRETCKNTLLTKYPESPYAKVLSDPNYIKQMEEKEKEPGNFYLATYDKYLNKDYTGAITNADAAINRFNEDPLVPKFWLLKALAIHETGNLDLFRTTLKQIIDKFPASEESARAHGIILHMDEKHPEIKQVQEQVIAQEIFKFNADTVHFFAITINSKEGNMNQLVFNIINYNLDNFSQASLNVKGETLNANTQIVLVKSFKNKNEATNYYKAIIKNQDIYKDIKTKKINIFLITPSNYATLMKEASDTRYLMFYNKNYAQN